MLFYNARLFRWTDWKLIQIIQVWPSHRDAEPFIFLESIFEAIIFIFCNKAKGVGCFEIHKTFLHVLKIYFVMKSRILLLPRSPPATNHIRCTLGVKSRDMGQQGRSCRDAQRKVLKTITTWIHRRKCVETLLLRADHFTFNELFRPAVWKLKKFNDQQSQHQNCRNKLVAIWFEYFLLINALNFG